MFSGFTATIIKAVAGTILEKIFAAFRLRRQDRERDDLVAGRALAKQRQEALENELQRKGKMADAQTAAPATPADLARRLLNEATVDGERSESGTPPSGESVPVVEGRDEGTQG